MINRRCILFILVITLIGCVSGCQKKDDDSNEQNSDAGFRIFYVSDDNNEIFSDRYFIESNDIQDKINEILVELKNGKYKRAEKPTIPNDIVESSFNLNGEILVINFDDNYYKLEGLEEVLRRASIVKTFCQLGDIQYVKITINGKPLEIDTDTIGNMSNDTFIDNIGANSEYRTENEVTIYYANTFGNKLKKLKVKVTGDGTKCLEEQAILRLIAGPSKIGYYDTMPKGVEINSIVVNDKKCYIDFNEAFLDAVTGVSQEVTMYSIVNTLTDLTTVSKVLITVNGNKIGKYFEGIKCDDFIERNFDVNEEIE